MSKKKNVKIFLAFLFLILAVSSLFKFLNEEEPPLSKINVQEDSSHSSNIINNVDFISKDAEGNIYSVSALEGEVNFDNNKIIYLKKIKALVKLIDSTSIVIKSDFGKYNTENLNTTFSKNVLISYLDNKITSEYLEFSMEKSLMTISKSVVYSNLNSILKADAIEIDINTKDTKIFMYENLKKVNITSKN